MDQEKCLVNFWHEGIEVFYYIPEHRIIAFDELCREYGVSNLHFNMCKVWWNTNLYLQSFVPTITPCSNFKTPEECLHEFTVRMKQRAKGNEPPRPEEIHIEHGILAIRYSDSKPVGVFIRRTDEMMSYQSIGDDDYIPEYDNLILHRNDNYRYWNGRVFI